MCVEYLRSSGNLALLNQVDHALHGFALVDRVGDHRLGLCGKPDGVVCLFRGNTIRGVGVVRIDHDLVVTNRAAKFHKGGRVVDDLANLCTGLVKGAGGVDADYAVRPVLVGEAHDQFRPGWSR